jgi:hypothetical protein
MRTVNYSTTERNVNLDEFLTPIECIEACVLATLVPKFHRNAEIRVCDVGANDGRWGKAVKKFFPNAILTGVELMNMPKPPEFDFWINEDFIQTTIEPQEVVIGNPPFTCREDGRVIYKAEDFVWKALDIVKEYGFISFLLRTNFKNTIERYWKNGPHRTVKGLHQLHHYMESWNLTQRPSFYREDKRTEQYGSKNTNAHDYTQFVWSPIWFENYAFDRQLDWHYQ